MKNLKGKVSIVITGDEINVYTFKKESIKAFYNILQLHCGCCIVFGIIVLFTFSSAKCF